MVDFVAGFVVPEGKDMIVGNPMGANQAFVGDRVITFYREGGGHAPPKYRIMPDNRVEPYEGPDHSTQEMEMCPRY